MISNRTRAARSFDFEITRMISDQIALHSVQLPLFKNDRETNWTELTFAKTSGSVTIGTGEKNWPIADSGVSSTIPETTAECVSASVLFSFLKRRMNTCIGQLVNTCTSLPQKQNE